MPRKLTENLITKLKSGDFAAILEHVKLDPELTLEVRTSSVVMVYYRKSKILSLHSRKNDPVVLSEGYWKNNEKPILDLQRPKNYFEKAKRYVDDYKSVKDNVEFFIQQKIRLDNSSDKNQFLVIDMEYQFEQKSIADRTDRNTRFDLVAIDLVNNKVLLLELKQGFDSLNGASGVDDHYRKFREHINHPQFKDALIADLKNTLEVKHQLGIFEFDVASIVARLTNAIVEFWFVFAGESEEEIGQFHRMFGDKYQTLYINKSDSVFILK